MVKIVVARYNEDIRWLIPIVKHCIIYNKGPDDLNYIPNHDKHVIKCENLGREAGTYIKHIIDNYNNLDDYTIFIQANPVDHIYNTNKDESYRLIYKTFIEPKNYNFKYISQHKIKVKECELTDYCSGIPQLPLNTIPPIHTAVITNYINTHFNNNNNNLLNLCNLLQKQITIKKFELTTLIEQCGIDEPIRTQLLLLFDHSKLKQCFENNYTFGYGALFIVSKSRLMMHSKEYWMEVFSTCQHIKPGAAWGLEKMWNYLLNN